MLSPVFLGKCGLHSERVLDLIPCFSVLRSPSQAGENSPQLPLATPYGWCSLQEAEPCPSGGGGSVAQLHCKITFFAGVMTVTACTVSPRGHSITDVVESPVPRCGGWGVKRQLWCGGMVGRRRAPLVRVGGTSPWQPGRWLPI